MFKILSGARRGSNLKRKAEDVFVKLFKVEPVRPAAAQTLRPLSKCDSRKPCDQAKSLGHGAAASGRDTGPHQSASCDHGKQKVLDLVHERRRFIWDLAVPDHCQSNLPSLWPPCVQVGPCNHAIVVAADFAGIGGPFMAMAMLGVPFRVAWVSESDSACQKRLRYHFGIGRLHNNAEDKRLDQMSDKIDIYFCSPPCQSFSMAGKRQGVQDARGLLIWHAVEVCRTLRPSVCIIENVSSLPTQFESVYDTLCSSLEQLGYCLLNKENPVLDTRQHGVPQHRERMFLVCVSREALGSGRDPPRPVWLPPPPLMRCPKLRLFIDGTGQPAAPDKV